MNDVCISDRITEKNEESNPISQRDSLIDENELNELNDED